MWNMILSLKQRGYSTLYLGGGVSRGQDDPLFKFKKSFGSAEKNYFVMKRIVDQQKYQKIMNSSSGVSVDTGFFPPYDDKDL